MDRLFGRDDAAPDSHEPQYRRTSVGGRSEDDIALERYRYLLRTAPPETIESVHVEAFSRLTPRQRDLLFNELSAQAPAGERPVGNDPMALAHSATRSEFRQPGTVERALRSTGGGGASIAGTIGGSMLGTVAGFVIGSALVNAFLPAEGEPTAGEGEADASDSGGSGDEGSSFGDSGDGGFGDFGGFEF